VTPATVATIMAKKVSSSVAAPFCAMTSVRGLLSMIVVPRFRVATSLR
jgi:hypothetical protein